MLVQIYVSKFLGFSRFTWGPVVFAYGHKGREIHGPLRTLVKGPLIAHVNVLTYKHGLTLKPTGKANFTYSFHSVSSQFICALRKVSIVCSERFCIKKSRITRTSSVSSTGLDLVSQSSSLHGSQFINS